MNPPRTKREYLRQLVEGKTRSFPPLTEQERACGFLGWHERGYLPHCDYSGLVQLVTFRLWDSMPASKRGEWEQLLKIEDNREKRTKLEAYLDRGRGECYLRHERVARIVQEALVHFDGNRYELLAWVIMPNHVHVLVHIWHTPLAKLAQSWKSYSADTANELLGRTGHFWEPEYWDTFMRDEEQERSAVRYIESNPVKAKLCVFAVDWFFSSARFRDLKTRTLAVPKAPCGARSSSSART